MSNTKIVVIILISILIGLVLSACSVDSSPTDFHAYNPLVNAQATAIAQKAMDDAESAKLLRQGIEQQVADEAMQRGIEIIALQARRALEIKTASNAEADADAKRDAEIKRLAALADTEVKAQPARLAGQATWYALSWTGAGVGLLVFCIGMAFAVVAWTNKRATTIYPNKQGQYPVIVRHGLGWVVFHDPSRNAGPGAVYRVPSLADAFLSRLALPPAQAHYPLPAVGEGTLAALSSQSNATAAIAAQNRWPALPAGFMARTMRLTTTTRASDPRTDLDAAAPDSRLDLPAATIQSLPSRVPLTGLLTGAPSLNRLVLGEGIVEGQLAPVYGDLTRMVHILAAGASGWGKSQFMRMLVFQLATASEPCQLVLADMERTTFGAFGNCARLLYPVIDDERDLDHVLRELNAEMTNRKELFGRYPDVDSLPGYNARADAPLAPIVLAIDEATSFLVDDHVSDGLRTLVRRGRKYGLWVTAGGQTFSSRDVDSATSLQFSSRIQFRAPVKSASQTLVDSKEARTLECPGRAILVLPGQDALKIQTPIVSYAQIIAALQTGRPAMAIPPHADEDAGQADRVNRLAAQGLKASQIAVEVFGYKNARTVAKVRAITGEAIPGDGDGDE